MKIRKRGEITGMNEEVLDNGYSNNSTIENKLSAVTLESLEYIAKIYNLTLDDIHSIGFGLNNDYIDEFQYNQLRNILIADGKYVPVFYTIEEIVGLCSQVFMGFMNNKLVEMHRTKKLENHLVRVPFSKKRMFTGEFIYEIEKAIHGGSLDILVYRGYKTAFVVANELGVPVKELNKLINLIKDEVVLSSTAQYLLSPKNILSLNLLLGRSNHSISNKVLSYDEVVKEFSLSNIDKGVLNLLTLSGILKFNLVKNGDNYEKVEDKGLILFLCDFYKGKTERIPIERVKYAKALYYKLRNMNKSVSTSEISKEVEVLLDSSVDSVVLDKRISSIYSAYSKRNKSFRYASMINYLRNTGYNVPLDSDFFYVDSETQGYLLNKALLGVLDIPTNSSELESLPVSAIVASEILGVTAKQLAKTYKDNLIKLDRNPTNFIPLSVMIEEHKEKIKEYVNTNRNRLKMEVK